MNGKATIISILGGIFVIGLGLYLIKTVLPSNVEAVDTLLSASATLSNPRLSYRAGVASGTSGASVVTIDASGNPDNNTNHLFPSDTVCFTNAGPTGCIGNTTYGVASVVDTTHFNTATPLGANLDANGYAIATQSGTMTITFTTVNTVPIGGNIYITIPMADSANGNDGIPDAGASTTTNGFDLNGLAVGGLSVTAGCTPANWNTAGATITPGSGTTDHTIVIPRVTSSCAGGSTITLTISGLVNPTPITSGHTQGLADNYRILVATRDGSNNTIDNSTIGVAPVEAVLISATVDETLSFQIQGIASTSGTLCGVSRTGSSVVTTATGVPWGTISTPNTFLDAVQQLTVSTNASGGYSVVEEENDQMGKNGATCTGAGNESSSPPCIQDTTCQSTACTTSQARNWAVATGYPGLGFTLQNTNGSSDAVWTYTDDGVGCAAQTYCARPLFDREANGSTAGTTIMTKGGPVSGSSAFACYRIAVDATQPAGYYYNKVKYTATAIF